MSWCFSAAGVSATSVWDMSQMAFGCAMLRLKVGHAVGMEVEVIGDEC